VEFKLFDVVKSIAVIAIVIFLYTQFNSFADIWRKPATKQEPTFIKIEDTAMKTELLLNKERLRKLEAMLLEQGSIIVKYAKDNKEHIDELAKITAGLKQQVETKGSSDKKYKGKDEKDKNKYFFKKIYMKDIKGEEFPAAWIMFYPNRDEDEQWKSGTYPLEFEMNVVESQSKDGTENRYAELFVLNNQMKETKGKRFPVEVKDIKWEKAPLGDKSFSFNMRISAYANALVDSGGEGSFAPGLGISFFSYGRTNRDMDWKFLGVGAAYDGSEGYLFVEPFAWNLGEALPLIDNLFIGPIGGMNMKGEWSVGAGISIPF
jgi:hypothetical protein